MTRLARATALLGFLWLAAGPGAHAATRSTREQVDAIELDLRNLQQVVTDLQASQAAILQSIADLRASLALDSPDRRSPADLAARLDSVETDLRIVQENQNDAGHRISVLSDKVDGLYRRQAQAAAAAAAATAAAAPPAAEPTLALDSVPEESVGTRPGETAARRASPAQPPPAVAEETPDAAPAAATPPAGEAAPEPDAGAAPEEGEPLVDPEELYQAARADYTRGSYDLAQAGFQEFLDRFPKSELADNALYWVGECHFSASRLEDAIAAFDGVAAQYPDSDKVPDAAYKKGTALIDLGRTAEGIIQLQHVHDTWPNVPAGRLAGTKLQALGLR